MAKKLSTACRHAAVAMLTPPLPPLTITFSIEAPPSCRRRRQILISSEERACRATAEYGEQNITTSRGGMFRTGRTSFFLRYATTLRFRVFRYVAVFRFTPCLRHEAASPIATRFAMLSLFTPCQLLSFQHTPRFFTMPRYVAALLSLLRYCCFFMIRYYASAPAPLD